MEPSTKKLLNAFLLAFFLGAFGAHRFYAGKIGTAVVQLILTLTIIGYFVTAIWVFIDWIILLTGNFTDKEGRKISEWT